MLVDMDLRTLLLSLQQVLAEQSPDPEMVERLTHLLLQEVQEIAGNVIREPDVRGDAISAVMEVVRQRLQDGIWDVDNPHHYISKMLFNRANRERKRPSGPPPPPQSPGDDPELSLYLQELKQAFEELISRTEQRHPDAREFKSTVEDLWQMAQDPHLTILDLVQQKWPGATARQRERAESRLQKRHQRVRKMLLSTLQKALSLPYRGQLLNLLTRMRRRRWEPMPTLLPHPPRPPQAFSHRKEWSPVEYPLLLGWLDRDPSDPRRLRFQRSQLLRLCSGIFEDQLDHVVLAGAGSVWLQHEEGFVKLRNEADGILVEELPAEEGAIPPMDEWLRAGAVEGWLATECRRLATSPLVADRVAAAGMLARLWGCSQDHPGGMVPNAAIGRWLEDCSVTGLEETAIAEVQAWRVLLEGPFRALRSLRLARDRLASTHYALRMRGIGRDLEKALGDLDLEVRSLASILFLSDDAPETQRWQQSAWIEPDAWWMETP